MVGDVRGLGPMMLVEFVRDRADEGAAAPDDTLPIVRQAVANGVIVMRAGLFSNCVRLLPPLTMPEDMLREGPRRARPRDRGAARVRSPPGRSALRWLTARDRRRSTTRTCVLTP